MNIEKGTICKVYESKYFDFPGGRWAEHFAVVPVYYIALESPSNSGNFKALDKFGRLHWLHESNIAKVKTA